MRVLAIPGSLRSGTNAAVLRAAHDQAPAGMELVDFDGLADVELLNPELEGPDLTGPPGAAAFRQGVGDADGLLLVSPEYGHSVPGVLKNALDWLVQSGELSDKRLAIVTASPTPTGGLRAQTALVQTLLAQNASIVVMQSIPAVKGRLDAGGELTHEPTRRRLGETLVALAEAVAEHTEWLAGRR
jgi:chromate reductase, NAD(P)H dehydrogenase (quinone)